jgi:hypothetical protein
MADYKKRRLNEQSGGWTSRDWEQEFPFVKKCSSDPHKATCKVCNSTFQISNSGRAQVHGNGRQHKQNEELQRKNRILVQESSSSLLTLKPVEFSNADKVIRAEILTALKVVKYHKSFQSTDQDNEVFKAMFPDSEIAKNYQMARTKLKYIIEFGIAAHIQNLISDELQGAVFSFSFETTTVSKKKQLDGYVTKDNRTE